MYLPNTPEKAHDNEAGAPVSSRTIASVTLDKRTREAKRRAEIIAVYRSALGDTVSDEPLMAARINEAAELKVIAESCRAALMRGDEGTTPNDVVRATRAANLAERALGLDRRKASQKASLGDYLASRAA